MDTIIQKSINFLKMIYIVHIIIIALIFIFNLILLSHIYWLAKILEQLYFILTLISIILFTVPIISLIFICLNKLKKNNFNIFKVLTIIFCVISIIFGFLFSGILMINSIESPEFCKECPFNLPIQGIDTLIKSNDLNSKCKERRCVINTKNYEIIEKNEDNLFEYMCNYDPTSEFEEIKESSDNMDSYIDINKTTEQNGDNIICNRIEKNNIIISDFQNNYIFNFYDKCNDLTQFFICERNKEPNKLELEENFVCPGTNYMTKFITFCMLNIILNLIINFIPLKVEYNKYSEMTEPQRRNNHKSNSFNSTLSSSKVPKVNMETEEKFERSPTEILIVCSNTNVINVGNNNIQNKDKNKDENNINNEIIKNNVKLKKIDFSSLTDSKIVKNKIDIKSSKNIRALNNNINIIKIKEKSEEEIKDKKSKLTEDVNKMTFSNDENTISTKRIILSDNNMNSDF